MSISLRSHRALVYEYHDAGTEGEMDSTYLVRSSGDDDDAWWCSVAVPTGHEVTVGMKADHRVDSVLGFAAECPIDVHDAVVVDGASYLVRAVLPRNYGTNEVQVFAERNVNLNLTTP
jgi:hypothetical protein